MSEKDTAAEVKKLANNVIDQAIFIHKFARIPPLQALNRRFS